MASGILLTADKRFFWNVDAHVGPGCPNKAEDVQLVQFGYFCMGKSPQGLAAGGYTPQEQAVIKSIAPGETYSGSPTDKLSLAIKAQQRIRGGTQDGRVSPIQNVSGSYSGSLSWMIVALDNNIRDVNPNLWPVLHRMPNCPPALAAASVRTFS
jgi:hypothetical protein